jgi:hypothetical protein
LLRHRHRHRRPSFLSGPSLCFLSSSLVSAGASAAAGSSPASSAVSFARLLPGFPLRRPLLLPPRSLPFPSPFLLRFRAARAEFPSPFRLHFGAARIRSSSHWDRLVFRRVLLPISLPFPLATGVAVSACHCSSRFRLPLE